MNACTHDRARLTTFDFCPHTHILAQVYTQRAHGLRCNIQHGPGTSLRRIKKPCSMLRATKVCITPYAGECLRCRARKDGAGRPPLKPTPRMDEGRSRDAARPSTSRLSWWQRRFIEGRPPDGGVAASAAVTAMAGACPLPAEPTALAPVPRAGSALYAAPSASEASSLLLSGMARAARPYTGKRVRLCV